MNVIQEVYVFSLIIAIIAVTLVIVLAGAALYYGGDAFNDGTTRAEVARYKNEASQIASALIAYQVEMKGFIDHPDDQSGNNRFGWEDLVAGGYLKRLPSSYFSEGNSNELQMPWGIREQLIILPGIEDDVCLEANRLEGIPTDEAGLSTWPTVLGDSAPVGEGFAPVCKDGLSPSIPCCFDPASA